MTNEEAIEIIHTEWKCVDRNDGIHCDRKCEECDLVLDVEEIRQAYNMAISALSEDTIRKSDLRLMKVEECAGHTIEYAKGWKACIEYLKGLEGVFE